MSRDIVDLHPVLRPICLEHQGRCSALGVNVELIETWRSDGSQFAEWRKGRNNAGEIIDPKAVTTNSRPGLSWHNVSYANGKPAALAYHLAVVAPDGKGLVGYGGVPMDDALYLKVGEIGESLGLRWGGRWTHPHDPSHFEYHPNGATLMQVLEVMKTGTLADLVTA